MSKEEVKEEQGFLTEEEIKEISRARTYEYELDWPIEHSDKIDPICKVTLRRFKGKDIKAISKIEGEYEQGEEMIMRSSGLMPFDLEEMEATDIQCLMEICAVFMDASQKRKRKNTGK